jgi:tetratricopeptide (TPR) repeat protein
MSFERKTAVLSLRSDGPETRGAQPLDPQYKYKFSLTIEGKAQPGGRFSSPVGDYQWHELMMSLNALTSTPKEPNRHEYAAVFDFGYRLYQSLCESSNALKAFFSERSTPRRLVIASECPEIHQLPWEAMLDEGERPLSEKNISIVHSLVDFDSTPFISDDKLRLRAVFGPGTERTTSAAFQDLRKKASDQRLDVEEALQGDVNEHLQADILQVEGHGDVTTGAIKLPNWINAVDPVSLNKQLGNRLMVLLWSCYSARVQSWGESLALILHKGTDEENTTFVLAFSTELHYETSSQIARGFYDDVFTARNALDPESAVVAQRKRLYAKAVMACEWASMTLWLRQPVDLSKAVLDGPRLPPQGWTRNVKIDSAAELREIFEEKVRPGRAVLIGNRKIKGPLPLELVDEYSGAVVHLRGKEGLRNSALFKGLHSSADKSHAGDRALSLLNALETYPRSLLLWSKVTRCEIQLVELLAEIPGNLAIVLVTEKNIGAGPGIVDATPDRSASSTITERTLTHAAVPRNLLKRLANSEESERFVEAVSLWEEMRRTEYEKWDTQNKVNFQIRGYWSFIRLEMRSEAERCIKAVERLGKQFRAEAFLLRGNFASRVGLYEETESAYVAARDAAANQRDRGRAILELAYLSHDLGDAHRSEEYYREAINLLERVTDNLKNEHWRSALGRVMRDYADLLAEHPERAAEGEKYLNRALAIHAIDDRLNQVAAALRTRGKLQRTQKKWAAADATLLRSASIFIRNQNLAGWTETTLEIARLSFERNQKSQGLAILRHAFDRLQTQKTPEHFDKQSGKTALLIARTHWEQGNLSEAHGWCFEALKRLPESCRKERVEAAGIRDFAESLIEK